MDAPRQTTVEVAKPRATPDSTGGDLIELMRELFPICRRSITGDGVAPGCLAKVGELLPLTIHEIAGDRYRRSSADWTVSREWSISRRLHKTTPPAVASSTFSNAICAW
mgnify:CR=1 FL=1